MCLCMYRGTCKTSAHSKPRLRLKPYSQIASSFHPPPIYHQHITFIVHCLWKWFQSPLPPAPPSGCEGYARRRASAIQSGIQDHKNYIMIIHYITHLCKTEQPACRQFPKAVRTCLQQTRSLGNRGCSYHSLRGYRQNRRFSPRLMLSLVVPRTLCVNVNK